MAEHPPSPPIATAAKIMRTSTFTFLQNFHHFTSTTSLLLLPFALLSLLSPSLITSSPLFPPIHRRFTSLSLAAGIPPQSDLFPILNLKLSLSTLSSLLLFPLTISSFLLAKTSIITSLDHHKPPDKTAVFHRLLITQLCNYLTILTSNATCFSLLIILFNSTNIVGISSRNLLLLLSATGTIVYSIVLANTYIICSLSMIISATENRAGFNSILKACVVIRGRSATALSLAVPMNMTFAGIEALFQYRVVRAYDPAMAFNPTVVMEAMLIAYLYGLILVLDTIVGYVFLKRCKHEGFVLEPDGYCEKR